MSAVAAGGAGRHGAGHHRHMTHPQRRAVLPDRSGFAERSGIRLAFDVYGDPVDADRSADRTRPTVLLLPTWQIIDSQFWKLQTATLARYFRVVSYDGRGTGRSCVPAGAAAYTDLECAADITAVLDATGTDRAVLVALSCAATWAVHAAATHPDRVQGIVAISPSCGFPVPLQARDEHSFTDPPSGPHGWAMYNRQFWLTDDFAAFRRFFFEQMCSQPHSGKQLEDLLGWSADIDPVVLADATAGRLGLDGASCAPLEEACRRVRCPVAVVHGTEDRVRPIAIAERLAELTGGTLLTIEGGDHALPARQPVRIDRLIRETVCAATGSLTAAGPGRVGPGDTAPGRASWVSAAVRPRRVLFLSSPIGLGHARRDIAVAAELRRLRPDIEIDWLAQHPVTRVLADAGERIHPASAALLNESAQIESDCGEHDLHAFQAIRRMDETLVGNFSVFADLVEQTHYELVVADEAWDVDYFLHENPELKRFRFAWLTDFVGWLPMPGADDRERMLAADLNAEMLEQRARYRHLRDRSIFVGNPGDVVRESFGPGLPTIDSWVRENFDFAGYVTGFDPAALPDPTEIKSRWGCRPGERLCVVTVGGSGAGVHLLRRLLAAVPLIRDVAPDLRFLVVAGPRIDPAALPAADGATVVGYLPGLYRDLAAADVAVVQGGLTTCMELTAARTPFVFVPLRHHFEQNIHVRHRLGQYRAGRLLAYEQAAEPELLADAVLGARTSAADFRPVETDGARRAAAMLAELL
jgi:pimeloyl-ACP methyl ester carboxylesterase/predicted glycosyltransferase